MNRPTNKIVYLNQVGNVYRQHSKRLPKNVENGKRDERWLWIKNIISANKWVNTKRNNRDLYINLFLILFAFYYYRNSLYQKRCKNPRDVRNDHKIADMFKIWEFGDATFFDELLKRDFPSVQFDDLDSIEHLIDGLHSRIGVLELLNLDLFAEIGRVCIERENDNHD